MCNVYTLANPTASIIALANAASLPTPDFEDFPPHYRIGIKSQGLTLRLREDECSDWSWCLWGLVPSSKSTNPRYALNNARSDKLDSWPWKLFQNQRCLVPASGFFEPEKLAGSKEKVPWRYYSRADGKPFFMPGLWSETVNEKTGVATVSYTIVITDANEAIHTHNRMPVILRPSAVKQWLQSPTLPIEVLKPCPPDWLVSWRVGDAAKNYRSPNTPDLIKAVDS